MDQIHLCIMRCPVHGEYAITLKGSAGWTRLTGSKCCGRWDEVKEWRVDSKQIEEIINEFGCAIEAVDE